jgi:TPR repeat protein
VKLDRFWITQILLIAALFAILIGSYLFSFGWFAKKTTLAKPATPTAEVTPVAPSAQANPATLTPPAPAAAVVPTCSAVGETPSLDSISASLSSNDLARQKSCVTFLQAESQAGDKGAELWLGRAYHNGWGIEKNLAEAAAHYSRAATTEEIAIRESAQQWLLQLQQEQQAGSPKPAN